MRTLLAMTCAAVLALAACGADDGTDGEAGDEATSVVEQSGSDTASGDGTTDDGSGSDGDAADGDGSATGDGDSTDDSAPADEAAAGGDVDAASFCAAMAELDTALELDPPLLDPGRSPDEVEELVVDVETKFDSVVATAPPDLQSDWVIVTDAFKEMTAVIRDADFVVADVDQATIADLGSNDDAFAAGERLPSRDEYCGS